jgi:anthranilate phosphoribosyltransferase
VHSYDGYDELTFTADAAVVSRTGLVEISFTNANTKIYVPDLAGGKTPAEAAGIVERVLSGKGTMAQEKVVAGNAALALQIVNGDSFEISMKQAIDCLRSGEAVTTLKRLKEWRLDE